VNPAEVLIAPRRARELEHKSSSNGSSEDDPGLD
jgi:hypothetical protein